MNKIFQNRNFSLLFYGKLVSSIGNTFFQFAISWYILELTNSASKAGFFMATGAFVMILLTPFAGVFADRYSKVKLVVGTDLLRGVVVLAAGIVIYFDFGYQTTMITLYATTILLAINGALFSPAVSGLQAEVVPKEEYQSANAMMSIINSVQGIVGVILGGTLYLILGVYWIFIIDGVSFLLSAISEMFIKTSFKEKGKLDFKSGLADFKEGFFYLTTKQGLLALMAGSLFINFAFTPFFANGIPYLFNQMLKTTAFDYSLVEISFSIGTLLAAIVIGGLKKQLSVKRSVLIGFGLLVLFFTGFTGLIYLVVENIITYTLFLIVMITMMFVFGLLLVYVNTPLNTAFMKSIDENYRGRVFGVIGTLSQGLVPLALLFGGLMIDGAGVMALSLTSGVILLLVMIYFSKNKSINQFLQYLEQPEED